MKQVLHIREDTGKFVFIPLLATAESSDKNLKYWLLDHTA